LIVGSPHDEKVSILKGAPGGLAPSTTGEMGTQVHPLVSDDFNGDKRLDLAVTDEGGDRISILLGRGNNVFDDPVYFAVGHHPTALAAGDFNEDGRTDLLVINHGTHTVDLLLNNSPPSNERSPAPAAAPRLTPHAGSDPWGRATQPW